MLIILQNKDFQAMDSLLLNLAVTKLQMQYKPNERCEADWIKME